MGANSGEFTDKTPHIHPAKHETSEERSLESREALVAHGLVAWHIDQIEQGRPGIRTESCSGATVNPMVLDAESVSASPSD